MQPAKPDKYELLLTKYDWTASSPPRGYQFGVGRGAKAFVTSAELSSGRGGVVRGNDNAALGKEEMELLSALEGIDNLKDRKAATGGKKHPGRSAVGQRSDVESASVPHKRSKERHAKVSMEDIAALMSGGMQSGISSSLQLVKKKARTEEMEGVESHEFSDDTAIVSINDILRSRNLAASKELQSVLGIGSSHEQTTWITHARAYREMGMLKKAQQALIEGCRLTGSKGPLIWLERMRFAVAAAGIPSSAAQRAAETAAEARGTAALSPAETAAAMLDLLSHSSDPSEGRRLAEEAVAACPQSEELWLIVLALQPPHERLTWLQQAVMAVPESESLWLRVLQYAPSREDQKRIVRRALQISHRLPLLWARLAYLESYERGKLVFNSAAAQHPSLRLIIEAAKFEEAHSRVRSIELGGAPASSAAVEWKKEEEEEELGPKTAVYTSPEPQVTACKPRSLRLLPVESLVQKAQQLFLRIDDADSRSEWLAAVRDTAASRHVVTAANLILLLLLPKTACGDLSKESDAAFGTVCEHHLPPTWIDDLLAFFPNLFAEHGLLVALWYGVLIVQRSVASLRSAGEEKAAHLAAQAGLTRYLRRIVSASLRTATDADLFVVEASLKGITGGCSPYPSGATKMEASDDESRAPLKLSVPEAAPLQMPSPLLELVEETLVALPPAHVQSVPASAQPLRVDLLLTACEALAVKNRHGAVEALLYRNLFPSKASNMSTDGPARSIHPCDNDAPLFIALARAYLRNGRPQDATNVLRLRVDASRAALAADTVNPSIRGPMLPTTVRGSSGEAAPALHRREAHVWVSLAIHLRSNAEPVTAFLNEALELLPSSERLWLMRLQDCLLRLTTPGGDTHGTSSEPTPAGVGGSDRASEIREIRKLYHAALQESACRRSARVWCFAALNVESESLSSCTTARALLLEAAGVFPRPSMTARPYSVAPSGGPGDVRGWTAFATLGLARVRVELRHEGPASALQVVHDTLQHIPKLLLSVSNTSRIENRSPDDGGSRAGCFGGNEACGDAEEQLTLVNLVGELISLSIDLEVPAKRGQAASTALQRWPAPCARDHALVLCSIAKLYFASSKVQAATTWGKTPHTAEELHLDVNKQRKALEQAEKAVQVSGGRCGDALALLLKLATLPANRELVVTEKLGASLSAFESSAQQPDINGRDAALDGKRVSEPAGVAAPGSRRVVYNEQLLREAVEKWVFSVAQTELAPAAPRKASETTQQANPSPARPAVADGVSPPPPAPCWGPHWLAVTEESDPCNVTLLGYRAPLGELLYRVAERFVL